MTIRWTELMVTTLRAMRERGESLDECASAIFVSEPSAMRKARELGLAGRMNRGPLRGTLIAMKRPNSQGD